MEILAHRGLWSDPKEKNSLLALFKALDSGYGLETDIRDLNGRLVISHDAPLAELAINLEELLRYYRDKKFTATLALNIKCDGLQEKLSKQLLDYDIKNYFVFDMSVPDTLGYLKREMTSFVRRSDLEFHPELESKSNGIWLDELIAPWINSEVINEQLKKTEMVAIVSAELHGRKHDNQWQEIQKALNLEFQSDKIMLCTDFPNQAKNFFK